MIKHPLLHRGKSGENILCDVTYSCGVNSKLSMGCSADSMYPAPYRKLSRFPSCQFLCNPQALIRNHNSPTAGHQGAERTLHRLRKEAYWISMAKDVECHCQECTKCQQSKLSMPQRAPLTNVPVGRPWEMIAVDILEVPISSNNNRYLLVVQDYFTKWAEAIPLPDQRYLPLVLYAYRTSMHSATGSSPFLLMYGRSHSQAPLTCPPAFDAQSYPAHLQAKLAELRDWVESNLAAVAHKQKSAYDRHSTLPKFSVGDTVWLSIPTAGKLDSRWEGGWTVKLIKIPVNLEITKGSRSKVIHTNCLRHCIQPSPTDLKKETTEIPIAHWQPPTIDHQYIPPPAPPVARRYPTRVRLRPDRYS